MEITSESNNPQFLEPSTPAHFQFPKFSIWSLVIIGVAIASYLIVSANQNLWPFRVDETVVSTAPVRHKAVNTDTSGWKTYTNIKYGFEIKYPEEFRIYSAGERVSDIMNYDMFDSRYERGNPEGLEIQIIGGGQFANKQLALNDLEFQDEFGKRSYVEEEIGKNIIFKNLDWLKSESGGEGIFLPSVAVYSPSGSLITLSIWGPLKVYGKVIDQILSTFKFIEPGTYTNMDYGFSLSLPESWYGYSVITQQWQGYMIDSGVNSEHGPQIIIRNPKWTQNKHWQDIPIMVFSLAQWKLVEEEKLSVSAAPIPPQKLAQNQKFVFALPPRWYGFTDDLGQDEAVKITKTFKVIPSAGSGQVQTGTLNLPPDPGEAGKLTLAGIDSDGDGVRDDVQRYIGLTYSQSAKQRASLIQAALAFEAELIGSSKDRQQVSSALDCLNYTFMNSDADVSGGKFAHDTYLSLKAVVLNTADRAKAFYQADGQYGSAITFSTPYSQKVSRCLVNPATLPN